MSTGAALSMTCDHDPKARLWARLVGTVQLWRTRSRARAALARLSERDLNDVGLSRSEAIYEVDKPFWRA